MYRLNQDRARRLPRLLAVALAVLALLCAWAAANARADNYAALGDSYAAGPLIPNQLSPLGCLKSDHNYGHLAAPSIGLEFHELTCSGATTKDMTEPQSVEFGPNPPQFEALDNETKVVSLTIGGNDIGFSEVAESCITLNPFATPCKDKYDAGGHDQLAERIANTAPKIAAVLQGIHSHAPHARVFVTNYPAIFPPTGSGCWPQLPIGFGDVPYLRSTELGLNQMIAQQAAANGATLVDWYSASIGHDACKSQSSRWVEPLIPGELTAPLHPTKAGMQGAATALVAAVK